MHLSVKLPSKQGIPIKVVVDDHVDRSGVKVLRDIKPTDTNYLIDLNSAKTAMSSSMRISNLMICTGIVEFFDFFAKQKTLVALGF